MLIHRENIYQVLEDGSREQAQVDTDVRDEMYFDANGRFIYLHHYRGEKETSGQQVATLALTGAAPQ